MMVYEKMKNKKPQLVQYWEVSMSNRKKQIKRLEQISFNKKHNNYAPQFMVVLSKYATIWDENLGQMLGRKLRIWLPNDAAPIQTHLYGARSHHQQLLKIKVNKLLLDNAIDQVITWRSSLTVIFRKKNESLRLCDNHCKLNSVTVQDSSLIQQIDTCSDSSDSP